MKPRIFAPLLVLVLVPFAYSGDPQPGHSVHGDPFNEGPRQAAHLMGGTGKVSFPVTTKDGKAQEFFDQGIGLLHGFWYFEAERSFRQVAALDPDCAMAYWGMAMANFNNEKRARPFLAAASKHIDKVAAKEKAFIEALAAYFNESKKDNGQRRRELVKSYEQMVKNDPNDLEAKAFLIWQLWDNSEHKVPIPSKPAMNKLISEVLAVEPMHPVHHYRIHITNPNQDRVTALASAALCGQAAPMVPHMWHMPGHTYSDSQRFADGAWQQEAALRVENAHMMRYRMMVDETYLFVHNRRWLLDNLSYIGRVNDAIDLCKHMVDLPRHPKFGQATATEGRKKLLELLTRHERWEQLISLAGTDYLDVGQGADQQLRQVVTLGQAYFATGQIDKGNDRLTALREMLAKSSAARKQAGDEAEAKARELKKSDEEIAKLRADAERRLSPPLVKLEKAEAELLGYDAQARGDAKVALVLLQKAGIAPEQLARVQAEAGDFAKALAQTRNTGKRVYKLANYVYVLHKAGKVDEAKKAFEELRVLAGDADFDDRALQRLQPLAENLKWPADWRTRKPADDVGERPPLDSLGPFRWQPWNAPEWSLPDLSGKKVSSKDFRGKPVVLIFYLGFGCVHCAEQLNAFGPMKADFEKAGIAVAAISTDDLKAMQTSVGLGTPGTKLPFPILADPRLEAFKAFRAYDDFERVPLHGTFLIDGAGRVRWLDIRFEPFRDPKFLLAEAKRLLALPEESLVARKTPGVARAAPAAEMTTKPSSASKADSQAINNAQEAIFASGATLKILARDGAGGEGPAWHPQLGLLTSGNGHICQLDPTGKSSIYRKGAGTNGLLFDRQGCLLACEPDLRRVTRTEQDGKLTVLTERFKDQRYNSPNDITVDSRGRIYFSDPRYGKRDGMEIFDDKGRKVEGVYRIDPDGRVSRVIGREVERANGVLVSPDDGYLYVADNNNDTVGGARKLWRFDLSNDGTVDFSTKTMVYDWGQGRGPDGVKQDEKGRLYVAAGLNKPNPPFEPDKDVKGGIYVLSPQGKLLAFLPVPTDEVTNCAFGGDDLQTLYITAGGTIYSIRTTTLGRVFWPARSR